MTMATSCETCLYFNPESRVCGVYGLPAKDARAMQSFCGDAGADHRRVKSNWVDVLDWWIVGVIAAGLAMAFVASWMAQPEGQALLRWLTGGAA